MSELATVVSLLSHATIVVKLTLLVLVTLSALSWGLMGQKMILLHRTHHGDKIFNKQFWQGGDMNALYQKLVNQPTQSVLQRIFCAGFGECLKLTSNNQASSIQLIESMRRAMKATAQREIHILESHHSFLATVGSVSPYIGLFGTVWGIMHAFMGLEHTTQATLQAVAPGIAEALIATAVGLFAAIPATIGYNRFTAEIERLMMHIDVFVEEFSNILQRKLPR